jgi:hypothetical protein
VFFSFVLLHQADKLLISPATWLLCAGFFALVAYLVPRDVAQLRETMRARAAR